jgi:hypothetical protein
MIADYCRLAKPTTAFMVLKRTVINSRPLSHTVVAKVRKA